MNGLFNRTSWDLTSAVVALLKVNAAPLFDVSLDASVQTPDEWVLVVNPPRRYGLLPSLARSGRRSTEGSFRRMKQYQVIQLFSIIGNDSAIIIIALAIYTSDTIIYVTGC